MNSVVPRSFPAPRQELFVGREFACRLLDSLVSAAPQGGGAGVVVGEPGIGKTALLHRIAPRSGARVAWVKGMESEQAVPFAAAADLLTPFRRHFRAIPGSQRRALERALALAEGPPPPPLAICAGALGVLSVTGDERPL